MSPRINRIEIQGFRAFGKKAQTLDFGSPISAIWAPNSQGKTSLAEAFEFLFTGEIVRRQLLASTQDEFADALRNAHIPTSMPVYVEALITGTDGNTHTVRRTLVSDYGKRQDCESTLEIDGSAAGEDALAALGIVLSQPPLSAPVLTQHTLGYLFSARPQDRATYFKVILEVTDLEQLRGAVADLDDQFKTEDTPHWTKLLAATAIPRAKPTLQSLTKTVPAADDLAQALDDAVSAVLNDAGADVPDMPDARVTSLETLLAERRAQTFPIDRFNRRPLTGWSVPAEDEWHKLAAYLAEREKVDEQMRRLTALFQEALAIPAVDTATEPIDCLLCGASGTLTPERIALIRSRVKETEAYRNSEKSAAETLRRLSSSAHALDNAAAAACPQFLKMTPEERRATGFRVERIRGLAGDENDALVDEWLRRLLALVRAWSAVRTRARALAAAIAAYLNDIDLFDDPQLIRDRFDETARAYQDFSNVLVAYDKAETQLTDVLSAVIDAASDTAGWQDLIELARDPGGLRAALIERHARTALQSELTKALGQIDKGNEKVLDEKFEALSNAVQHWWDLLRPGEPTFFSAVKPRKGARRTVDFKAGLSLHGDRSAPKLRDVIAVFSQSQLHCLGLALFIARTLYEGSGFMILDDPILASDEDYRAYFKANVLEELLDSGVQVILLTQDQKTWKDLEHRYLHRNIDMFQMAMLDPADGTTVTNSGDDLMAMITRIDLLARGTHPDLRKQAGELLRNAAERFCKEMLVKDARANGKDHAAISDHDGKNLGQLCPKVEGLLTADPSHPGKLRSIGNQINPAKHDDSIPDQGTIKVALGDLRDLKKQYLT